MNTSISDVEWKHDIVGQRYWPRYMEKAAHWKFTNPTISWEAVESEVGFLLLWRYIYHKQPDLLHMGDTIGVHH